MRSASGFQRSGRYYLGGGGVARRSNVGCVMKRDVDQPFNLGAHLCSSRGLERIGVIVPALISLQMWVPHDARRTWFRGLQIVFVS